MPTLVKVRRFDGRMEPIDLDTLPHYELPELRNKTADTWISSESTRRQYFIHPDFHFMVCTTSTLYRCNSPDGKLTHPFANQVKTHRVAYEVEAIKTFEEVGEIKASAEPRSLAESDDPRGLQSRPCPAEIPADRRTKQMTITEAASYAGRTPRQFRGEMNSGVYKYIKVGRQSYIFDESNFSTQSLAMMKSKKPQN